MRTISQSPPGSKMAQDASRALLLAETERKRLTGLSLPSQGQHTPPQGPVLSPARVQDIQERGGMMLFNDELADLIVDRDEDDPFDFDAYLSEHLPAPMPVRGMREGHHDVMFSTGERVPVPLPYSERIPPPRLPPMFKDVRPQNSGIAILWHGETPQPFLLTTQRGVGQTGTDDCFPVNVQPHQAQVIELPRCWQGAIHKQGLGQSGPATTCEVAFNRYQGFTFFKVSYVDGNNGPVVMRAVPSGVEAGSQFRALDVAPIAIMVPRGMGSARAILGTRERGPQRSAVARFYQEYFQHPRQGAILPDDESSVTQVTRDRCIVLEYT